VESLSGKVGETCRPTESDEASVRKQLKGMEVAGILNTRADFDSYFERAVQYLIRGLME
jgi:hypothetical protein